MLLGFAITTELPIIYIIYTHFTISNLLFTLPLPFLAANYSWVMSKVTRKLLSGVFTFSLYSCFVFLTVFVVILYVVRVYVI